VTGEGARLRAKLDLVLPELRGATALFMDHPGIADLYPEFLFSCFLTARGAVALMRAALAQCASEAAGDPVCAELAPYLESHVAEEAGHDEWFLEDLEALGWDREAILARIPGVTQASLLGAQYYWVLHQHPVAILGFLAALEGNPPTPALVADLMDRTGSGPQAFRTLLEHAVLDPRHGDEVFELLDRLALSAEHSTLVGLSALHAIHMESVLLLELVEAVRLARPGTPVPSR